MASADSASAKKKPAPTKVARAKDKHSPSTSDSEVEKKGAHNLRIDYKTKHTIGKRRAVSQVVTYDESVPLYEAIVRAAAMCEMVQSGKSKNNNSHKQNSRNTSTALMEQKTTTRQKFSSCTLQSKSKNSSVKEMVPVKEKLTLEFEDKVTGTESNLLALNHGKKLSVCLIRLRREASLNAAAKVNLIYKEAGYCVGKQYLKSSHLVDSNKKPSSYYLSKKSDQVLNTQDDGKTKAEKYLHRARRIASIQKNLDIQFSEKKNKKKKKNQQNESKNSKTSILEDSRQQSKVEKRSGKQTESDLGEMEKSTRRIASLNAQAIMIACKEKSCPGRRGTGFRAARTHFIFTPKKQSGRWVDGLGLPCDTMQRIIPYNSSQDIEVQTDEPASSILQIGSTFETSKSSTKFSHFSNIISSTPDESACASFPYLHTAGSIMSTHCQTYKLSGITSLTSLPYHRPYGSAFSVPCNHGSIPHYGYYAEDGYYTHPSSMVQSIPEPCVISHSVPIHVPHAEVKVLIHNPQPGQPFIQTTSDSNHSKVQPARRNRSSSEKQRVEAKKRTVEVLKSKRKYERKSCDQKDFPNPKLEKIPTPPKRRKSISSCGWSWEGEPQTKPIPNVLLDGAPVERKCYPAIRHDDGEIVKERECVLLRSGTRKKDVPFTAKVIAFWENPTDGEMMMSLLWYYRPEHTESGRKGHHVECEIFASKHRDENSIACIDDKCYVLTFNEYCRYKAEVRHSEERFPCYRNVIPAPGEAYPRKERLPPVDADPDTVFLCRQVYDFRQKRILKNPS